ncbi:MAG: NADH-ubiquinone oxidoreductase-F iron-sulfur binding region domain-containing protein [Candidatus Thermoplasmatota archaeon]|jgi:NADH-quinone oxidoreductase subunit F|nr:NADH-ubiquinone oxidoreductase-F iron-sulfur binding region domain-containing protein [Candidatus Thermoplasmatota archaeon]
MESLTSTQSLDDLREKLKQEPEKPLIIIASETCGEAQGSQEIIDAFADLLAKRGESDKFKIRVSGCLGLCEIEPIVIIRLNGFPGILYKNVTPKDVEEIANETLDEGKPVERLLYVDPKSGNKSIYEHELPFYKKQMRNLLINNIEIDQKEIMDYIRIEGYSALQKTLFSMKPDEIVDSVKRSGLRGRGGGGFPTGRKWESSRNVVAEKKYIVCNADEGDPGAYMDRNVLEGNPHSVIEGMLIGAYAVGANYSYIYVRSEYPIAVDVFTVALKQARELGLLGKNILGSGFDFDILIYRGGGAFVCGESSALLRSIEGKAGEPRAKHTHATESGLWGYPTVINNVETWSNIPLIINNGHEWYAGIGTENSKGTKIFSLMGKVRNTGLVEVPMGMSIREIVFDIGGGIPNDRVFKAVQTGGPSGGCIPEPLIDIPVDFDELTRVGSIMGSGGMIVMDEDTCMVDVARYFTAFNLDESCGKCSSCREGNSRMLEILDDIVSGMGDENSLLLLEELCEYIASTSLCGLGKNAPNPVITTMKYFKDEYLAHVVDKACPAKVCKDLIMYEIQADNCTGCTLCARKCPINAISGERKKTHVIDQDVCNKCGTCFRVCRFSGVGVKTGVN